LGRQRRGSGNCRSEFFSPPGVVWTDFTLYMDSAKYIDMDVHKETISIAVRNSSGKLVMESD
jgi:hypothetical protein